MSIAAPMVLKLYIFLDYKRKTNVFYSIFEEKKTTPEISFIKNPDILIKGLSEMLCFHLVTGTDLTQSSGIFTPPQNNEEE